MLLPIAAILGGLVVLVWSADKFVDGASATARYFGMAPLLIGMIIIGFGTSAPEIAVSALAALQGNPGLALGNAFGSNISNIALILGATALICPMMVHSKVLRKELPILAAVTVLAGYQVYDGFVSFIDALVLMLVFSGVMGWSIYQGLSNRKDKLAKEIEKEKPEEEMPIAHALMWIVGGLILLVVSSRFLVWGSVEIAQAFGVSDLIIGLTIVALGTSLPELASTVAAVRKGEHDMAIGNVIGSNLFNTLTVVGIAGLIHPMEAPPEVFNRDVLVMFALTMSLFIIGYGFKGRPGRINRLEGAGLLVAYVGYNGYLLYGVLNVG